MANQNTNRTKEINNSEMNTINLNDDENGNKPSYITEKKYIFDEKLAHSAEDHNEHNKSETSEKTMDDPPPIAFTALFKFSSFSDKVLIFIGTMAGLISGATNPVIIILLGQMLDSFVDQQQQVNGFLCGEDAITTNITNVTAISPTVDYEDFLQIFLAKSELFSLGMAGIALVQLFLSFIIVFTLTWAAENQALQIRQKFMQGILRQNIGWFDKNETGDFASRITADLVRVQDGIGEKLGICIYFYSTCVISLIAALYYGWQLTLVILSIMPILVISSSVIAKIQAKISGDELSAYGKAGAIAEEVLSSIRTVASFNGEKKEIARYEKELIFAKKNGIKRGLLTSIGMAIVWFCIYASYALAFWYGAKLVLESRCEDNGYSPSNLVVVFFCVLTGAMFVGQTAPYMEAFAVAKGAAAKVYGIIELIPPIDSSSEIGLKPDNLIGHIKFINAKFRYPARTEVQVLQGLNLEAIPGETVALVGSSGCGKSTVIQLVQRFYDLEEGEVLIDGKDIRELNIGWLRDRIGVVGQEPVLFATTISENIRYGFNQATEQDVIKAAKAANAHHFISTLPQAYNTQVGERGTQLSGGQKQRIAIARALVRNPKILLLDEATSALDNESESVVQAALDEARKGRTTIVVAHRLTTIRNANKIIAVENGKVKEVGTHDELMELKGTYFNLVTAQMSEPKPDEEDDDEEILKNIHNAKEAPERHFSITSTLSGTSTDATPRSSHRHSSLYKLNSEKTTQTAVEDLSTEEALNSNPPKSKLMKLASPEWPYILVGCVSAFLMGVSIPVYGIIFGDILESLNKEATQAKSETDLYSLVFLIMGVASGIAIFLQTFMFSIAGECLTMRLRKMVFTNMIRQEMAWFDCPENGTGALCSRLSSDASHVQGATGSRIATMFQALSTVAASIFIGLFYNYKIGLVVLAFVPVVLLATYFESRVVSGHLLNEKIAFEDATKLAVEAIENIRTVASLHQESTFYVNYASLLAVPHKKSRKKSYMRGITFGLSQCIPNLAYGVAMYYGSILVADPAEKLTYGDLFKVLEGIILGCMMIGQAVAFAPDYQRAKISAVRIFKILEKTSTIDPFDTTGLKPENVFGEVEFSDIRFSYPTRSSVRVLRGLNLDAHHGETIALVGSSGCGKSTCIQLMQRFYDSDSGNLFLDNANVKDINLNWLRSKMGIVSQEPVLFSYSIAENIAYGDNSREVTMDEVIDAAKKANIHSFVTALPAGYDTNVGDRGTQLSGGQKQRIAIARALVRNPQILLLDEATSALDTESEKVVQEALDNAREGRTCIVIAHRLTTIQNADQIIVISKGKVVERGKHHELLANEGLYHKLHSIQGKKNAM